VDSGALSADSTNPSSAGADPGHSQPEPITVSPLVLARMPTVPGVPGVPEAPTTTLAEVPATTLEAPTTGGGVPARFAPGVSAKLKMYVYLLVDPRTGRAFHVGRGRGDRCFRHVEVARSGDERGSDHAGGSDHAPVSAQKYPALERIREAESTGREVRIDILRYGLTAAEAQLVQVAARDALGLTEGGGLDGQRAGVDDLSAQLAKRAKIKRAHQTVLLRIGGARTGWSYETVRHGWRLGQRWTDPSSTRSPRWAFIVVGDLIEGVYALEGWEQTGADPGRYSFTGSIDGDLESRYVGRSVAPYLGAGPASPVTYVWCGPHWVNTAQ